MIIFYNKQTGKIEGTIDGRIHPDDHLKMWIGDKDKTERLIVQWKPVKNYKDEKGNLIAQDFEPQHEQKELWVGLEKREKRIYDYKVDVKTKLLVKK
jgi:hypothetical protein